MSPLVDEPDLGFLTDRELVELLRVEHSFAPLTAASYYHYIDIVSEEIHRRWSFDIVDELIEHANDDTVVQRTTRFQECLFDTPLRVKDKVRYYLSQWLEPSFSEEFGLTNAPWHIDIGRAKPLPPPPLPLQ